MLIAGWAQFLGGSLLLVTFLPVPLWFRIPVQIVGVALLVAGFPALTSMIAQVVPASIRGISFSVTSFLGAVSGALSPLVVGIVAEQYHFTVAGEAKGHLANAFLTITPLVLFGALVVLRGRRFVPGDLAAAAAEQRALQPG
jgi:MFS family permease